MSVPFDLHTFAVAAAVVCAAYVIFGISAFGAALFTVPALSYLFPLDFVLPLCVLLGASLLARICRMGLGRAVASAIGR